MEKLIKFKCSTAVFEINLLKNSFDLRKIIIICKNIQKFLTIPL